MPLASKFPPIFVVDQLPPGVNARHNFLFGRIRYDATHYRAVLAQEVYEWRFLALWSVPTIILAMLAVSTFDMFDGVRWFFGPLLFVAGANMPRWVPSALREAELRGHTIEALLAADLYGADFETKMRSEAQALARYKEFSGWSVERIEKAMRSRIDKVDGWAARFG